MALLDLDFTVTEPPELVARLRTLATRYARATATTDPSTGAKTDTPP
ncbi:MULTISPECIES: hypothetical protein [unclassified Micromonospora]